MSACVSRPPTIASSTTAVDLSLQRRGDELFLVTAPEVSASVERHLGNPRPTPPSRAASEVLALTAHVQSIARAGIELIRDAASDSALDTLLQRGRSRTTSTTCW